MTQWCVPYALHLITGKTYLECLDLIKQDLGDQPIEGVYLPIALGVLERLGYKCDAVKADLSLKFYNHYDKTYLIEIQKHALVMKKGKMYDNHSPRGTNKYYRARTIRAFQVYK